MTQAFETADFRYRAFISYSHRDKAWADWLHKALETYRVPSRLVGRQTPAGTIPRRLAPIFRDRDELASSTDLGRTVNQALGQAANLIVICSPHSAASRWVHEEVLAFKRLGRSERVFCLIVGGEPHASGMPGREAEECLAAALRHPVDTEGTLGCESTEPVAADVRPGKDGKTNAKLKLIAGMLDVEFDQLKQRELQRRNRRMTAVTAVALAIMLLTSLLAIDAMVARRAAERRQKQAEDLVGFMLGDLNDKLAQVQRLDILEAVDDKAMAYFQSLPTTDITDESREQRAKALEKIGSVRLDQGHLAAAASSFVAAAKLSGPLAEAAPHDTARQVAYSRILAFIGMSEWYQGKLDSAQQHFESARAVLQHAEDRSTKDPELIFQLASLDNNIGHVLEARGRLDEAAVQYRAMLAHCRELVGAKNVKPEWMEHLGEAHNNLGKVALMRGDLLTAVAEYAADDAIESELSARDPGNNDQRENMARVRAILGRTLALTAEADQGMRDLQEAVGIATQLSRVDPGQASFQEKVALYSSQLARLRRLAGDPNAARTLTARALKIFSALTQQDPANTGWRQALAEARVERAAQSLAAGSTAAARGQAQAALDLLGPLLAAQPDERSLLLADARARLQLAEILAGSAAATALREETLQATRSVKSGRDDPRLLAVQVEALLGVGRKNEAMPVIRRLWEAGYRDLGLLAVLQREQVDYPLNTAFRERLQQSLPVRRRGTDG
jgi:eukaryotic-like serine/threonine-protein kinase